MSTNYQAGHDAEKRVADYLRSLGFEIRALNWKTPRCEIDIVAQKEQRIYFVEVKYRKRSAQGKGVDYVTSSKLKQMSFAAETWVWTNSWDGEYQLAVVSVEDREIEFIDEL